jgi:PAS domain S-box-containing protein
MTKKQDTKPGVLEETRFKALIEHAHDGIILYDANGVIRYASPSIHRFGGYTAKEIVGKKGSTFLHPEESEKILKAFFALKVGESITYQQRLLHKKGYYRWGETTLTNQLHLPEVNGIICNFRSIDERKQAEEKSAQFQSLLETINQNLEEGIFLGEFGEKFLYANKAFLRMAGYKSFEELAKTRPRDFYVDDAQRLYILSVMAQQRIVRNQELQFYRKDRKKIWVKMTISLLAAPDRQNQYIGTVQDITEQKKAELKFQASQQLLTSISNNVQEGFFRSAPAKGLIYVNDSYAKMFGYSNTEEVLNIAPINLYANPADRKKIIDNHKKQTKVSNTEVLYRKKDGSTFWGSLSSTMFKSEDGTYIMDGVVRDITEIKRKEDEFFQLHSNLRAIMESTQESIYALDKNFRYLAFNDNHKKIMKLLYDKDIVIGGDLRDYLKGSVDESWYPAEIKRAIEGERFTKEYKVHYESHPNRTIQIAFNPIKGKKNELQGAAMFVVDITNQKQTEEKAKQLLSNLTAVLESTKDRIFAVDQNLKYLIFNKSHEERAFKLSGRRIKVGESIFKVFTKTDYPNLEQNLKRALAGEDFSIEMTLPTKNVVEVSYSPVKDVDGKITGAAAFVRDVTLRKQNEQKIRALNEELINQNWKLEAREQDLKMTMEELSERNFELDQFMYKTSHDLRSPLSSVLGLINLAKLDSEKERVGEYLDKIEGRIIKLDEFVRSMLSYAKVSRAEITTSEVLLEELIMSCIKELEYLENFKKVKVSIKCKNKVKFRSDEMTLKLIAGNIVSNAFKYYNSNVKSHLNITIDINTMRAAITFEDNGIGIHKEYLDKIFDMFFRATEKSEGSGLGMYIVKQAVDKLKGTINITSEYGVGTTIKLVIPNL